jgi:hypothetical protein
MGLTLKPQLLFSITSHWAGICQWGYLLGPTKDMALDQIRSGRGALLTPFKSGLIISAQRVDSILLGH